MLVYTKNCLPAACELRINANNKRHDHYSNQRKLCERQRTEDVL